MLNNKELIKYKEIATVEKAEASTKSVIIKIIIIPIIIGFILRILEISFR